MQSKESFTSYFLAVMLASNASTLSACADAIATKPAAAAQAALGEKKAVSRKELHAAHQVHVFKRRGIAGRLNQLWAMEREIKAERERLGRAGDMVSVTRLERDLLSVRQEIDRLRKALSRENKVISLIDEQMAHR